jgi:hypothetical protein
MFTSNYFGKTPSINIHRGTIQGNTLSPYLFLIFLEPLLRWLQRGNHGYHFKTSPSVLCSAAYANDLVLFSNESSSLQTQLLKIEKLCDWASMDLGIPKCALTGYPNKSKLNPPTFKAFLQIQNINYHK